MDERVDSILHIVCGKMFHKSQSCVRHFVLHISSQSDMYRRTRLKAIHTIVYIQILMESTLYETTERALIDSLGLFSIKKIPFGLEESLRWGNRNKEREKIERWVNTKSDEQFDLLYEKNMTFNII